MRQCLTLCLWLRGVGERPGSLIECLSHQYCSDLSGRKFSGFAHGNLYLTKRLEHGSLQVPAHNIEPDFVGYCGMEKRLRKCNAARVTFKCIFSQHLPRAPAQ